MLAGNAGAIVVQYPAAKKCTMELMKINRFVTFLCIFRERFAAFKLFLRNAVGLSRGLMP